MEEGGREGRRAENLSERDHSLILITTLPTGSLPVSADDDSGRMLRSWRHGCQRCRYGRQGREGGREGRKNWTLSDFF